MYEEEKVNKEKPDGNAQAEPAVSTPSAPSESCSFCCGSKTDCHMEAQRVLSEGFYGAVGSSPS